MGMTNEMAADLVRQLREARTEIERLRDEVERLRQELFEARGVHTVLVEYDQATG